MEADSVRSETMEVLRTATQIAGSITGIVAALVMLIKPLREWVMGTKAIRDGQKCLLRHNMLHIYYKHRDEKMIRQYEFEDFIYQYKAYKAQKGNSFIDKIYSEIQEWEVIS